MTDGEVRFYLREISTHWSTSNVSVDKLAELKDASLIEINTLPFPTVRLTHEGARRKSFARPPSRANGLRLNDPRQVQHNRPRKKAATRAKRLV